MADVKISQLTALASASTDVAGDVLAIVDTSATQTKKISVENLVAPITLDKSNARIGIGQSSPTTTLDVNGAVNMSSTLAVTGAITGGTASKITSSSADTTFSIETTSGTSIFPILDFVSSHSSVGGKIRQDGSDVISFDNSQNATFASDVTMGGSGATSTLEIGSGTGSSTTGTSQIYFRSKDEHGGNTHQSYIKSTIDGSSSVPTTKMSFHNRDSGGTVQEYLTIKGDGKVGIGTASPGDYSTSGDDFVVKGSDHTGISIVSPTNKSGNIMFADGTSGDAQYKGFIQYDHGNNLTDVMVIGTNGSEKMRITSNSTQVTASQYGLGINCSNAGELSTSGTTQRYLSVDGGSNGGVVELRTSQNGNDYFMGAIDWVNAANGDSSNNDADGRLVCAIRSYTKTSDSNSGDDSGGHMLFYTKPEAGNLTLRWSFKDDGQIIPYGSIIPASNNSYNLGSTSYRWSVLYTSNAVNVSDETLKTDIQNCDLGIDFINTLKPKSFKMKDLQEEHDDYNKKHYGLIAQDLKDGKLKDSVYGDKDGDYGLAYNDLVAPLIKAVQELSSQNDSLKSRIEALENA